MKRENKSTVYIKICMLFLLLSGFVDSVSSKDFKAVSDSVRSEQQVKNLPVFTSESCVSIYENQTVSSKVSVLGCDTLTVRNVTVSSKGDLTLFAPNAVLINGPFETQLGGVLNITKKVSLVIEFTYDGSGNRTSRRVAQEE